MFSKQPPTPTKLFELGKLSLQPSNTAAQQLQDLKEKIEKTSQLTKSYTTKFAELAKFNKTLTEGYIKNINVIVDIGSLLNMYNGVFVKLMSVIQEFDSELVKDIDPNQIAHIRALTDTSLQRVNDFFKKDVENVKQLMAVMQQPDMIRNLTTAIDKYDTTQKEVPRILATLSGGAAYKAYKLNQKPLRRKRKVLQGKNQTKGE